MTSSSLEKRIVVIDDEPDIREMCVDILAGYTVQTAADGSEIAPLLTGFQPQVVITDMRMPRESGLTVIRLVKQHNPGIEVLVMTGHGKIEEAVEAMKLGASDFILKPFEITQMLAAVRKCFDRINLRLENAELQMANRELQRLNELKRKFLRLTSHELRGPLTILQGYCDLLPLIAESQKEVKEAAETMANAVGNLTTIVQNLTLLMTTQKDAMVISGQRFDVVRTLNLVLEEIKVHSHHRNQSFVFDGPPSLPVIGDPLRVAQIARELLFNSVKFTKDGGLIVVTLKQEPGSDEFSFDVTDNGIGLDESLIGQVFDAFFEAGDTQHHSTSRTNFLGGGIGIGLTLVRDIVRAYGGRVGISSRPDLGTSVLVTLPSTVAL